MFDSETSDSGRVKGSIKDRIISFLYRKRFKIKLLRNKLIKRETKIRFIYLSKREIKNYRDLKKLGDKVIDVDIKTENFDFDKYDYYIIEPVKKKGIDISEQKEIKENKKAIDNSKKIITDVKRDIKKIGINLKYPDTHKEDISYETKSIPNNINKLKEEIVKIDNKIDVNKLNDIKAPEGEDELNNSLEIINHYESFIDNSKKNIEVVDAISNVSFKKKVGINVKHSVDKKNRDKNINSIKVYKTVKLKKDKTESKKTVKVLNKFDGYKIRMLKRNEEIVKKDVDKARSIIDKMNKEVDKVTKEISKVTKTTGYSRMIASCLRVATGILTLPFSKINIFNITLGSALINRGLKGLRKGLDTKSEIKVNYKYEDLSNMIKDTKDKTKLTELLIIDSLSEIKSIKDSTYLGEKNIKDLTKLEDNLNKKLKEIDKLNKKLNKQDERNKIKIKIVNDKKYN